jgi:hypothetical protein
MPDNWTIRVDAGGRVGRVILAAMLLGGMSATWAARSWYLVVPPRSDYDERAPFLSGYKILEDTPLSEWGLAGIFENVVNCVAKRDLLTLTEHKLYLDDLGKYLKSEAERTEPELVRYERYAAEVHYSHHMAYSASRCVPTEDPGLRHPRKLNDGTGRQGRSREDSRNSR